MRDDSGVAACAIPARTIPRATIVGTVLAAVVYIVSTAGVMSLVPPEILATSTAPFADGARRSWARAPARLVALGAAISCFGALERLGARRRDSCRWRSPPMACFRPCSDALSARGTPVRGMVVAGVLGSVLVAMNYSRGLVELFTFVILLATLSTLVPYVFCSLAVWLMPGAAAADGFGGGGERAGVRLRDVRDWRRRRRDGVLRLPSLLAGLPLYVWVKRTRDGGRHERAQRVRPAVPGRAAIAARDVSAAPPASRRNGGRSTLPRRRTSAARSISMRPLRDLLRASGAQLDDLPPAEG